MNSLLCHTSRVCYIAFRKKYTLFFSGFDVLLDENPILLYLLHHKTGIAWFIPPSPDSSESFAVGYDRYAANPATCEIRCDIILIQWYSLG